MERAEFRNLYDDGYCSERGFHSRQEADYRSMLPTKRKRVALIRITAKQPEKDNG